MSFFVNALNTRLQELAGGPANITRTIAHSLTAAVSCVGWCCQITQAIFDLQAKEGNETAG